MDDGWLRVSRARLADELSKSLERCIARAAFSDSSKGWRLVSLGPDVESTHVQLICMEFHKTRTRPLRSFRSQRRLAHRITRAGDWFHNINLRRSVDGAQHFLGDFPNVKWKHIRPAIAKDLAGASVLDIGCNAASIPSR